MLLVAPRGTRAVLDAARRLAGAGAAGPARRPAVVVVADPAVAAGAAGGPGLLEVAAGRCTLAEAMVPDPVGGFDWLPLGGSDESAARPRPRRAALSAVLERLAATRDVLVAAPAVLESVEALDLSGPGRVSVLVAEAPGTSNQEVREAERLLRMAAGEYLGRIVMATKGSAMNVAARGPWSRR
ncbi:hypothetical protein [Mycolicibacterium fallax]|uniref:Uncharacterized protein n=1 Tax=Mycolicibacterium fallax TaxID=1793 RepID=A0A1X1QW66_MYCFA|nr:hypothetical protein [Mycolicibacterium fallax]ORU95589.1 hypothetical protein AWC04_19650 [Mycolicibacterium fallax]BBY99886.1 hypothetical protein MFAL_33530 [Mycolicibacterium fallax]